MNFILRRSAIAIITLFLVSVFCFLAFSVIRGDPASLIAGTDATPRQLAALREELGLDRGLHERYFDWLGRFVSGNLGNSMRFRGEPVSELILQRFPVTFTLASISLFFILIISAPISLLSARGEGGLIGRAVNILTALGVSMPGFFMGLLFIWIFGLGMRLFSPGVYIDWRENAAGFIGCLCFPALAIAVPNAAVMIKFLRGSLLKEQNSEYARTALSKGANSRQTLRRHVLRNALVPAVTVFAMIIAEVFSGSIVIEQVFNIPGIGRLLIIAISSRDYPVIQTLVVYIAFIVIIANTLADIAIQIIDPRIRLEKREA